MLSSSSLPVFFPLLPLLSHVSSLFPFIPLFVFFLFMLFGCTYSVFILILCIYMLSSTIILFLPCNFCFFLLAIVWLLIPPFDCKFICLEYTVLTDFLNSKIHKLMRNKDKIGNNICIFNLNMLCRKASHIETSYMEECAKFENLQCPNLLWSIQPISVLILSP